MNGFEIWRDIQIYNLPQVRADRWMLRYFPQEVALVESQVAEMYEPKLEKDTVTACMGLHILSVNRHLTYRIKVAAQRVWLKPQRVMAVRTTVLITKQNDPPKVLFNTTHPWAQAIAQRSVLQNETILDTEYTWFLQRYACYETFRWRFLEERVGVELLDRRRLLKALGE